MKLLFIDEATSEPLKGVGKIAVLTGIVVPLRDYVSARSKFYQSLGRPKTGANVTIDLAPIELHGRKLLPLATDDEKIAALTKVVDLVLQYEFAIYRFGYVIDRTFARRFKRDDAAYSLSWADLIGAVQPEFADGPIIPIADAGNPALAEHMSGFIRGLDVIREAGFGPSLSVQATENIIGEVFFGDSKYSVFVQVADIVSYLLLQRDMRHLGWATTPFKDRVLQVADRLVSAIRGARLAQMQGSNMVDVRANIPP